MSQLSPFVRSFRALATAVQISSQHALDEAKRENAEEATNSATISLTVAMTLAELGDALDAAATDLEQQIAADLSRTGPRVVPAEEGGGIGGGCGRPE